MYTKRGHLLALDKPSSHLHNYKNKDEVQKRTTNNIIKKKFYVDNFQDKKVFQNFQWKLPDELPEQIPSSVEDHWHQLKKVIITFC